MLLLVLLLLLLLLYCTAVTKLSNEISVINFNQQYIDTNLTQIMVDILAELGTCSTVRMPLLSLNCI